MMGRKAVYLVRDARPRADERHVATKNIDELRQLIETRRSQPATELGDNVGPVELVDAARGRLSGNAHRPAYVFAMDLCICVHLHRAELEESELTHSRTKAGLAEEDGASRVISNSQRDIDHEGRENEQA